MKADSDFMIPMETGKFPKAISIRLMQNFPDGIFCIKKRHLTCVFDVF